MKTNTFIFFLLLTASCSNYKIHDEKTMSNSLRLPSSIGFENFINADHPEKIFFDKLELLKSLYLRAESGLQDFDHELDTSVATSTPLSFQESKSYRRMVAIWNLNHQIQNELETNYAQLKVISKNLTSDKKQKADLLLTLINQKLSSKDEIEMFAFEELKKSLEIPPSFNNSLNICR